MAIFITGGAGFLGSHLTKFYNDQGISLIMTDIQPFHHMVSRENKCYYTDVRDYAGMDKIFRENKIEYIIHCAAALPLYSTKDIYSTNRGGTSLVLALARQYEAKVIHISTTAVYGGHDICPLFEWNTLNGVGHYGRSKVDAESCCDTYRDVSIILRPKTFIGPTRLGIFSILYEWISENKRIPIIGNGQNHYQLLDVADLVIAIDNCINKFDEVAKIHEPGRAASFNIGAKEFGTVKEDLNSMFGLVGSSSKILTTPAKIIKPLLSLAEKLKISPIYKWIYETADKNSFVSILKAEQYLDYKPKYSNVGALVRSYNWYLEHKEELKFITPGDRHTIPWREGILKAIKQVL